MDAVELYKDLDEIVCKIPADLGGGSSLAKAYLMAQIALDERITTYVEIGVYYGRSFIPMSRVMRMIGGVAYGIDPYEKKYAKYVDDNISFKEVINNFVESTDFENVYKEFLNLIEQFQLNYCTELIRLPSADAIGYFRNNSTVIDMIHVDGNHETSHVVEDIDLYFPLVKDGGIIVLDDIDWISVKPALNQLLKNDCTIMFINEYYVILRKGHTENTFNEVIEKYRLNVLHQMALNCNVDVSHEISKRNKLSNESIKISVLIITYNHEEYIDKCFQGIISQKGDFDLELIIGNDGSTDLTTKIISNYIQLIKGNPRISVKVLPDKDNIGMIANLKRCLEACTGDYFAVCDGDDYWIDINKLEKQLKFMQENKFCSLCFHDIFVYKEEINSFEKPKNQQELSANFISTRDIIKDYVIGNISSCFYDAKYLEYLPDKLFELDLGDWMFNIFYSQFGQIGHLKEEMSVYQKHDQGVSSGRSPNVNVNALHEAIYGYNEFLNFVYDKEFSLVQLGLRKTGFFKKEVDLLVIDDFFPNSLSGFRWQEFLAYLDHFSSMEIFIYQQDLAPQTLRSTNEIIKKFKQSYPQFSTKISTYFPEFNSQTKLIYVVFLNLAYKFINQAERHNVPFIFCLYPGGGFLLNDEISDNKLERITKSPCFKKVIVTQKITYNYLIDNGFCQPNQIEHIFGGVIPQHHFQIPDDYNKSFFRYNKKTLDICFVAHKYTKRGIQKGYDVFIDVAHKLYKKFENVVFHVVGGYDEFDIDISKIKDRIFFYGIQDMDWFDEFYKDKDIILSPNIHDIEEKGQFDGFPTASCLDAGIRRTAIFCTDELHLNDNHFSPNEDIVIIPYDVSLIVDIISYYYNNPDELKQIAECGQFKIRDLFNFDVQIGPRIKILEKEIDEYYKTRRQIQKELSKESLYHLSDNSVQKRFEKEKANLFSLMKGYLLIKFSGYYDKNWYLENNPDVRESKMNPIMHYLIHGGFEGRNPSIYFNSKNYMENNSDVELSGLNPLVHFLLYGRFEKRKISN